MRRTILRSPNLAEGGPACVVRLYERARPRFRDGGLASAASSVRDAGRGGDEILLHINPEEFAFLKHVWGEPSTNPHTGLPEYGFFSKLKKALKFEKFNVKGIWRDISKNPQRLLVGAVDPLGTKIANTVLGTKWKPVVNQLGGATKQRFADAEAAGIDTGTARTLHGIAGAIAGFYGGNAIGNLASEGLGSVAEGLQGAGNAAGTAADSTGAISEVVPTVSRIGDSANAATALAEYTPNVNYLADYTGAAGDAAGSSAGALTEFTPNTNYMLTEFTPSVDYIGTAATPYGRAAIDAARYGQTALKDLGPRAVNYAKQPKNWATIGKGLTALSALAPQASGASDTGTPPEEQPGEPLPQLDYLRTLRMPDMDWYSYGQGPEAQFYSDNVLPPMPGKASGGTLRRHVKGPGSGRSDSIPARLSDGEYVLTAEDVSLLGDGSNEAGARRLDQWRKQLRKHKGAALAKGRISPNAKPAASYLNGVT